MAAYFHGIGIATAASYSRRLVLFKFQYLSCIKNHCACFSTLNIFDVNLKIVIYILLVMDVEISMLLIQQTNLF